MSKNQQKHKGWILGFFGLIILIAVAFIYHQINPFLPITEFQKSVQIQLVDAYSNSVEPNNTLINEDVVKSDIVNAKDYEQFWLWTPPKDDTKLSQAHTLYLLQGEISPNNVSYYRHDNSTSANNNTVHTALATLIPQGLGVRSLTDKKIWLVYRATSQEWSDEVMAQLIERLEKWQRAGNQVMGIQIDYDAPTYQLDKYAQLLKSIRKQLPTQYQLSVTGLLDWSNQVDDAQLSQLSDAVDELVIQTYQGTTTLSNYAHYLKKLEHLSFNFKVGIIEGGQWQGAAFLEDNPHFKGYVVFLR